MNSSKKVDARGLSCPQPVVMTRQVIKSGEKSFEVLVNSTVSKENVIRCVEQNNLKASVREEGEDFIISVSQQ